MIRLKSAEEIARIKKAGQIASSTLRMLGEALRVGITTYELDGIARDYIVGQGAFPAFKDYKGYPANICTSIDNVIVHGIPDKKTPVREGSVISIDVGIKLDGYFADSAYTFGIGRLKESTRRLMQVTREALYKGIDQARAGNRLGDVSSGIQQHAETNGYSVVRNFVGHGVGYDIHEDPEVPNFGEPNEGIRLEEGMVLAIEPMVNEGLCHARVKEDGWTVVTQDCSLSCHFEHTISIGKNSAAILTEWPPSMK